MGTTSKNTTISLEDGKKVSLQEGGGGGGVMGVIPPFDLDNKI